MTTPSEQRIPTMSVTRAVLTADDAVHLILRVEAVNLLNEVVETPGLHPCDRGGQERHCFIRDFALDLGRAPSPHFRKREGRPRAFAASDLHYETLSLKAVSVGVHGR